jgi:Lon protease-like protein
VNTGCTATVERILKQYDDGRMDILAIGRRRFEIISLNDDKPYLRGTVEFFDDEKSEEVPADMQLKAIEGFRALQKLEDVQVFGQPEIGDPNLSFHLAQLVPDLNFRQLLLNTRSEMERIRQLVEFLPVYLNKARYVAHVKEVAPKNGHGKLDSGSH